MMRKISILGSTGSIGTQTLRICRDLGIGVAAVSAGSRIDLLEEQVREFNIPLVSVFDPALAGQLRHRLSGFPCTVLSGEEGNELVAAAEDADTVVTALMGMIGLKPTLAAIRAGKRIALANKETLVCGGQIVIPAARKNNVPILPVDSEHSAIFQCIQGAAGNPIKKILLTASGGPFYGYTESDLKNVTVQETLRHPNWSMGAKITVDSATLMNKGLEWMEAKWLFGVNDSEIEVLIHRESIVHSAVEFADQSVIAQMGVPTMYLPIKYALTYPERVPGEGNALSLYGKTLHFDRPDEKTFRCLRLAKEASIRGGLYPTALNGANEETVALFLKGGISFADIPSYIESALSVVPAGDPCEIENVLEADRAARAAVRSVYEKE